MAQIQYRPNHASTGHYLRSSSDLQAVLHAYAEQIAVKARANMPHGRTGELAASVHVEDGHVSLDGKRITSHVTADTEYAAAVEFGNKRVRGQHPLRRALG